MGHSASVRHSGAVGSIRHPLRRLAADDDGQLVAFVRRFEEVAADLAPTQPGCLFVSFIYEASSAAAARAT